MSLTDTPLQRLLPEPGQPFVVYAIWIENVYGRIASPSDRTLEDGTVFMIEPKPGFEVIKFSASYLPGAALGEFAVGGSLAAILLQVHPSELPIALSLKLETVEGREGPVGEWQFRYLGQADAFSEIWQIPADVQPVAPRPLSPDELNQGAEDQVRESLGIPEGVELPGTGGQLPPEEESEEPYRFDPTRHMDLDTAEPPPPLPDPLPGPVHGGWDLNSAGAPPPLPEPRKADTHSAYGDQSVPFAH